MTEVIKENKVVTSKNDEVFVDFFTNDIFGTIKPSHNKSFNLIGTKLPSNQDIYFVSKWHEVFDRYSTARRFLRKAKENNFDYWFNPVDNPTTQKSLELMFKADLFETSLINYNILVDLSWTWAYVSAEYVLYTFDDEGNVTNAKDVYGMHTIEDAYELLRKTENGVVTPHSEGNPFNYLKKMRPEFTEAMDIIIDFWKYFSNSNIRNLYNFIKHKGKPKYKEIEALRGGKVFSIHIGDREYPSDITDVQKIIELESNMDTLIAFDNEKLYPYIKKLLMSLKKAVQPSPFVF